MVNLIVTRSQIIYATLYGKPHCNQKPNVICHFARQPHFINYQEAKFYMSLCMANHIVSRSQMLYANLNGQTHCNTKPNVICHFARQPHCINYQEAKCYMPLCMTNHIVTRSQMLYANLHGQTHCNTKPNVICHFARQPPCINIKMPLCTANHIVTRSQMLYAN